MQLLYFPHTDIRIVFTYSLQLEQNIHGRSNARVRRAFFGKQRIRIADDGVWNLYIFKNGIWWTSWLVWYYRISL